MKYKMIYNNIRKNGQVALEFMMLIGMAVLLMSIILVIVGGFANHKASQQKYDQMYSFGRTLQNELLLAATVHEGYSRTIYLPDRIGRYVYSISNEQDTFTLRSSGVLLNFKIPETTGTLKIGENIITNQGGVHVS